MVGGADPFALLDAPALPVGAVCRQLGVPEEATENGSHDREMPRTAFPSPHGLWRVEGGGCVASGLGPQYDQIITVIGIRPLDVGSKTARVLARLRQL